MSIGVRVNTIAPGIFMAEQSKTPDPEVIHTDQRRVSCDGGGGTLGHPVVWYSLDDGEAECGYCDRKFIYTPSASGGAH